MAEPSEPALDERKPASASNIDIFLRVKPAASATNRILVDAADNNVEFCVPRDSAAGLINNSRERYCFAFNGILTAEAKQDEVFERAARPLVSAALDGFNGTIFAYGQTGSGKTFTITGGVECYVDRGIIPRTIAAAYSGLADRADFTFQVYISYLEIYNEVAYDLLDPRREVAALEDLPQVTIQEDEEQRIHFKNLSLHRASSEEEALNLLFLGDTNRTIAETPSNQASSRSHCIFTLTIEARRAGGDTVRRAKLHLVDLAGSERVAKTGIDGTILREAKFINLSLHYLEQVIVALQERSMGLTRGHVPYRNSLMTLVLRDSLGGNCRTVMVATISGEAQHVEESISTCRFAQRVALVKNEVSVNEEVDPSVLIARLKQEVRDLKEQLRLLRGDAAERGPLTSDELQRLRQQLLAYVAAAADDAEGGHLSLGADMTVIRASWQVFKQLLLEAKQGLAAGSSSSSSSSGGGGNGGSSPSPPAELKALQEQVRKLRLQVQQRDNEIAVMVGMLRSRPGGGAHAAAPPSTAAAAGNGSSSNSSGAGSEPWLLSALLDTRLLADRHRAFEVFMKSYRAGEVMEDNKQLLKAKYEQAKALAVAVNASKGRISELRAQIEHWRRQRSAACVVEGQDVDAELATEDAREQQAKQEIEQEKASYKAGFGQLRDLKGEIEHLQLLLEQSRSKLQQDFQQWLAAAGQQLGQQPEQTQTQPPPSQQQQQQAATADAAGPDSGRPRSSRPSSAAGLGRSRSSSSAAAAAAAPPDAAAAGSLRRASASSASSRAQRLHKSSSAGVAGGGIPVGVALPAAAAGVDVTVLAEAAPHLTGNPAADADIIRFYEAKAKLMQKLAAPR